MTHRKSEDIFSIFDLRNNRDYILKNSTPLPSGCRSWRGGVNGGGVNQMVVRNESGNPVTRTVRQVFMAGHTMIDPNGSGKKVATPTCGNRNCVNPDHLRATFVDGTDGTEEVQVTPRKSKIVKDFAKSQGLDVVNVKLVPIDSNSLKGIPVVKRGRGRPKGSKNKVSPAPILTLSTAPKRGRGRPKGSVNKAPKPVKWW